MRPASDTDYSPSGWARDVLAAWNRFWFQADDPHTLALIRIFGGWMIFYTHLVWTLRLPAFLGPHSWISAETSREAASGTYVWTFWWYITSPVAVYAIHGCALIVFAMLVVGWHTRIVSVLAWLLTISYCHRLQGALFGLDQVNAMLAMYLMLGPSGAVYSVDDWLARRRNADAQPPPTIMANIAIRLLQWHMCIIYLFGGIAKGRGLTWWQGDAIWFSVANFEYQSLDLTWLVNWPSLVALVAHVTVFWEMFYCVLIWPRLTRPIMLGLAVLVHGGIMLFLGMPTFGFAMIVGNAAFLPSDLVRRTVARWTPGQGRAVRRSTAARGRALTHA